MTEAAYRIKTKHEKEHNSSITTDIEMYGGVTLSRSSYRVREGCTGGTFFKKNQNFIKKNLRAVLLEKKFSPFSNISLHGFMV